MDKLYTRVNWHNLPNTTTPINETNLNNMDNAIDLIDSRVVAMDNDMKSNYVTKQEAVTDVTYSDGELHVTKNGVTTDTEIGGGSGTISVQATLTSSAWSNKQQSVTIQGVTTTSNGFVGLDINATVTQREAARMAILYISSQSENTITITADGDVPSVDIPITVTLV